MKPVKKFPRFHAWLLVLEPKKVAPLREALALFFLTSPENLIFGTNAANLRVPNDGRLL